MTTDTEREASEAEQLAEREPERRVQHLCDAARHWHSVGTDDRARQLFERAMAEEGHAVRDERIAYARFLFDVDDTARAHEVLDELWRSRELTGSAYYDAGTLHDEQLADPVAALRWYTSGIVRLAGPTATGTDNDVWIELLIGARRSVRGRLGEPTDEWDELWDTSIRAAERQAADTVGGDDVSSASGRNDPCPCGSGRKYKKCCGAPDA